MVQGIQRYLVIQGIQRVHSGPRYTRVPSDHRYTKNTHWSKVCKRYMVVPGRQMVLLKVQGINVYIYTCKYCSGFRLQCLASNIAISLLSQSTLTQHSTLNSRIFKYSRRGILNLTALEKPEPRKLQFRIILLFSWMPLYFLREVKRVKKKISSHFTRQEWDFFCLLLSKN